jgi:hypothetical protein
MESCDIAAVDGEPLTGARAWKERQQKRLDAR